MVHPFKLLSASMRPTNSIATIPCGCEEGVPLKDGSKPEYLTDERKVYERFLFHCRMGTYYWSVHHHGRHVLTVTVGGVTYAGIGEKWPAGARPTR